MLTVHELPEDKGYVFLTVNETGQTIPVYVERKDEVDGALCDHCYRGTPYCFSAIKDHY